MAQVEVLSSHQFQDDIFRYPHPPLPFLASNLRPIRIELPQPHIIDQHENEDDGSDLDGFFTDLPPVMRGEPEHLLHTLIRQRQTCSVEVDSERAFFMADLGEVWKQHQRWGAYLPRVEPFYAVKCNPDPYVLRLLAALGTGFDCASYGEISRVLALGVDASRIIFANPCKATSFIRNAAQIGVDMMTFDNADELHKIACVHPHARLVLRILTDDSKSVCRLGSKFGAALESVPRLLKEALTLGLNVVGVSFHVGSGCYDPSAFGDAVQRAHTVFNIGRDIGFRFNLLDIGGGFEDMTFDSSATIISQALDQYFPPEDGVRIIAEPGRYYVAAAFTLATNVIARRLAVPSDESPNSGGFDKNECSPPSVMYYINDGVYGSFNCILFDHQIVHPHPITLGHQFLDPACVVRPSVSCSIWGPTCDSIDCVNSQVDLPCGLEVGDWIGFPHMGAYTICAASQFNGFQESNVHYCSGTGERSRAVRRALGDLAKLCWSTRSTVHNLD